MGDLQGRVSTQGRLTAHFHRRANAQNDMTSSVTVYLLTLVTECSGFKTFIDIYFSYAYALFLRNSHSISIVFCLP